MRGHGMGFSNRSATFKSMCTLQIIASPLSMISWMRWLKYVFELSVRTRLLSLCSGTTIVTIEVQRIKNTRNHNKLRKLSEWNNLLGSFQSYDILGLYCKISYCLLLGTFSHYRSSTEAEYKTRFRIAIISVSFQARITITAYNKLFRTSINPKHILSSSQVLDDILYNYQVSLSSIRLIQSHNAYSIKNIYSWKKSGIQDRS